MRNRAFAALVVAGMPLLKAVFSIFPKQANGFAFAVEKPHLPNQLHPWLKLEDGKIEVNQSWIAARYRAPR